MYAFDAELWLYEADAAWHFVTLPVDVSEEITERTAGARRGFGSVRVRVATGGTTWTTSVFPDSKRGAYVLPVKQQVRKAEQLAAGDVVRMTIELLDPDGTSTSTRTGTANSKDT